MQLTEQEFQDIVADALDNLPALIVENMKNIEVLIETWPSQATLQRVGLSRGRTLLGLYTGIPLTRRGHGYGNVTPDTITLYQGPIERYAQYDIEKIRKQVRHTIIHEFAHHFGISDERLIELGAY